MNKLTCFISLALLLTIHVQPGIAQNRSDSIAAAFFKQRNFAKYFISDIYSPTPQIVVGPGLSLREYNLSPDRKKIYIPYNETNFGAEIPVYTRYRYYNGTMRSKWALSLPICAVVWFDFTEKTTAPILNTDYRFALVEFNYLRATNKKFLKNYAVKLIPFFHESTHIGDELTIFRIQDSFPITRVNVSYEAAELAVTLNDANGSVENNTAIKLGARFLLNPKKGWYSIRSIEGDTSVVVPTSHSVETYLQLQHQRNKGFLASKKAISVISIELRNRVKFGYPIFFPSINDPGASEVISNGEYMTLCFNGHVGWKFNFNKAARPRFGAYIRAYIGMNPYGQFRNIPLYQYLGLSFIYEN